MTGFIVDGPQLLAHGEGSVKQSENFTGLEKLLEQARVSDDCFGPLFFYFKDKYYESLMECQAMANQAASYLTEISGTVKQTAEAYGAAEADNATGLANVEKGVGDLAGLNSAGDSTRKNAYEQASAYGSSWSKASQDVTAQLKDPGSPPEAAFAAFNARMEQLKTVASPGQAFIDNGLGWLISIVISPLVEFVLEPAVGDPEQIRSTAKGWENVAGWLQDVADSEDKRSQATAAIWQGEAGERFRAQMTEFGDGARAMAGDVRDIKGVLETAADIFDTFVMVCVDIIQELVLGLIIEWLAALAASWVTFGSSVAAATGLTTAQVAITGTRLGTKVADLFHKLKPLITALEKLLVTLRKSKLGKGLEKLSEHRGTFGVGKRIRSNPLTNVSSAYQNTKDADKAMDNARDMLDAARKSGDQDRIDDAYKAVDNARQKVRNADSKTTTSTNSKFGKDATGEQALAQNVFKATLGYLGPTGTTDKGKAIYTGVLENVPGAAVERSAEQAYDHAEDPSTDEERKAAQQRGFATDDTNPPRTQ
ncbi:WXG100 family type VII secretion target [Kibdelosporangium persicum]|uniref:Excreted virulence factor EspC (Type VII ESX diderm) n=1 Tax=Kibdelosporangium persicum TaxID=2698649 RepID=A0ABX2F245_9PSEU|nr:WXG100 family type VII secretion target [Kibdelosporangium persicum]NRN65302.1 Excreted virulence factor EspC (Type VII ESX diderm) [Kibdelosporangium persicum]